MRAGVLMLTVASAGAAAFAYAKLLRPTVLNWGATQAESASTLPGDDVLPNVRLQTTRSITIEAPSERVWPWLVQMGPKPRAGVYTYDWLERLLGIEIENSDRILPEFQHLEPGDFFALGKHNGITVLEVQPGRALVLQWQKERSTWAFVLNRDGDGTRLLSRNRIPGSGIASRLMLAFMEPASLVMERKMLQGIKKRAESKPDPSPQNADTDGH